MLQTQDRLWLVWAVQPDALRYSIVCRLELGSQQSIYAF